MEKGRATVGRGKGVLCLIRAHVVIGAGEHEDAPSALGHFAGVKNPGVFTPDWAKHAVGAGEREMG